MSTPPTSKHTSTQKSFFFQQFMHLFSGNTMISKKIGSLHIVSNWIFGQRALKKLSFKYVFNAIKGGHWLPGQPLTRAETLVKLQSHKGASCFLCPGSRLSHRHPTPKPSQAREILRLTPFLPKQFVLLNQFPPWACPDKSISSRETFHFHPLEKSLKVWIQAGGHHMVNWHHALPLMSLGGLRVGMSKNRMPSMGLF